MIVVVSRVVNYFIYIYICLYILYIYMSIYIRPLTGPTRPKLDPRMKRRTPPPRPYLPL